MQPSYPDRNNVAKQPLPTGEHDAERMSGLERAARIADLKDKMLTCLEELDRLQLVYPANYLCHAIEMLDED